MTPEGKHVRGGAQARPLLAQLPRSKKRRSRRRSLRGVLGLLVLLLGVLVLAYPAIADRWNTLHASYAISSYTQRVDELDPELRAAMFGAAQQFNRDLRQRENPYLLSESMQQRYERLLNLEGDSLMGDVDIPVLRVRLPIYHGTAESTLQVGVGHLEWTSLPVGGASSHCVLSGHTGLPSARLFTDLDQLKEGDRFYLHIVGKTLTYEVDQILVVLPEETEALQVVEGEDLCTLMTCTPYGINSHRLLVRGHRVQE